MLQTKKRSPRIKKDIIRIISLRLYGSAPRLPWAGEKSSRSLREVNYPG
jgi:hypothetical protein